MSWISSKLLCHIELIAKSSKVQVVNIEDKKDLAKYLQKNLINDEIVIGLGAGSISKWMYNLKGAV